MLPAVLRRALEVQWPAGAAGLVVAVSGGADSACLLAALAALRAEALIEPRVEALIEPSAEASVEPRAEALTEPRVEALLEPRAKPRLPLPLRALHVDHGLTPASAVFRRACESQCARWQVPLQIIRVDVAVERGTSLEAQARDARRRAFAENLTPGECLLTAHHELDQAETVLLQLLRGAGLPGLAAMPACQALGKGWHLRPLLDVPKRELERYAAAARIEAVDDPMNADCRFDRVYLREQLWPGLEQRWPGAAAALSRSARHAADAQELLNDAASLRLQRLRDGEALSITGLRAMSTAEQRQALRFWIEERGAPMLPAARLREALRQITEATADHLPVIAWAGHALRRYRERLYLTAANPPALGAGDVAWAKPPSAPVDLGTGLGSLSWRVQTGGLDAARLPGMLEVRGRAGGETLKPARRARTQSVQHLCQRAGVLPWMRDALPMVYAGDALIAVGDLWQDARWCVDAGKPGIVCEWTEGPVMV